MANGGGGGLRRELGLRDLVLFNIAALAGIRWLSAAAHAGPGSITLWILAVVFFFLPSAFVVSALSKRFPNEGGLYIWTRHGFGDWHAFLCGWLYYLNNLFWIPSLLLAGVGMAVYIAGIKYAWLAENPWYALPATLAVLWMAVLTNLVGMHVGKWTDNLGGASTYIILAVLASCAGLTWWQRGPATPLNLIPDWNWGKLNFWSQLAFALTGLELGAILSGEIRDPERNVPRAAWLSGVTIAAFYIVGTASLLVMVPAEQISPMTGLAQAGGAASQALQWRWISPIFALLVTCGIAGQLGAYIGGCARLPFVIGIERDLPPVFGRLHPRWGTPYFSILVLGFGSTFFLLLMQMGETVRNGYQVLVDMSVITLFIPFLYIFGTAWKYGQRLAAASGLVVSVVSIVFALLPPDNVKSVWWFEAKLVGGCALLIILARFCFTRGKRAAR